MHRFTDRTIFGITFSLYGRLAINLVICGKLLLPKTTVQNKRIRGRPYSYKLPDNPNVNLTTIFLFSLHLISMFFYGKCFQEKTLVPIIVTPQKIKKELGGFLGVKNPARGKFILNHAFKFSRKLSWDKSAKAASISR